MKIKLIILFLAILFIFTGQGRCSEFGARQSFYQGNIYYSKEKFKQAIADYEKALESGFESGPLYYNLGNAYFKQGSLGKAILNYLRAQRLIPRDADLNANLNYARSLIKGGPAPSRAKWFRRIFFNSADSFSLNEITLITVVLYFIGSFMIILLIVTKNSKRSIGYIAALVLAGLLVSTSLFCVQFSKTIIQKQAVVIARSSDAKFEPFGGATTFFTLNEGEVVSDVASRKDWIKIKRIDGKQGWIKASALEFL